MTGTASAPAVPASSPNAEDEAYEIGLRDGYAQAIQEIDIATGGDGEFRYCMGFADPERHCPDEEAMKRRILARFS